MEKRKESMRPRRGDRMDATLVRDLDSMHVFLPLMLPGRADNEAFLRERIDLTALEAYIQKKNAQGPEHRYTMFHAILAALGRTIQMRPRMNRFIMHDRYYDRNHISFSLIAKKAFSDQGEESIVILKYDPDSDQGAMDMMHDKLCGVVYELREKAGTDSTTDIIDMMAKMPHFLRKFTMNLLRFLDNRGRMPKGLATEDPYNSTVFISNLGSIQLDAGYHHLTNWGTNSVFVTVGKRHMAPFYDEAGAAVIRPALEIGITLDERIGDGYYFSRTVKLLNTLLTQPDYLDVPAKEALHIDL